MKDILPNEEGVDDKTVDPPDDDIGPVHYLYYTISYNIGDFLFILTYTQKLLFFFFHLGQTIIIHTQYEVYLI